LTLPTLLIPCVETCGLSIAVKLPIDPVGLEQVLAAKSWFASVVSPGTSVVFGLLCPDCAKRVYPPESWPR
jgi:hypothetical protein